MHVMRMVLHNRRIGLDRLAMLGSAAYTRARAILGEADGGGPIFTSSGEEQPGAFSADAGAPATEGAPAIAPVLLAVASSVSHVLDKAEPNGVHMTRFVALEMPQNMASYETRLRFALPTVGGAPIASTLPCGKVNSITNPTWLSDLVSLSPGTALPRPLELHVQLCAEADIIVGEAYLLLEHAFGRVEDLELHPLTDANDTAATAGASAVAADGAVATASTTSEAVGPASSATPLRVAFSWRVTAWVECDLVNPRLMRLSSSAEAVVSGLSSSTCEPTSIRNWWAWSNAQRIGMAETSARSEDSLRQGSLRRLPSLELISQDSEVVYTPQPRVGWSPATKQVVMQAVMKARAEEVMEPIEMHRNS